MSEVETPLPVLSDPEPLAVESGGGALLPARPDLFWRRLAEFLALYLVLPTAFLVFAPRVGWLIPGLMIGAVVCGGVLWMDASFERRRLAHLRAIPGQWRTIAWFAAAGGAALAATVAVWAFDGGPRLFDLPRRNPALWVMIMVFYPLFSVYPQEVIYRAFLMHRYREVFPGNGLMIAASAAAFAYGHVIFQNWLAVSLSLIGGVLFAWRYERSRSLASVWVEHAIWGCVIFTVGLGRFFYLGAAGG